MLHKSYNILSSATHCFSNRFEFIRKLGEEFKLNKNHAVYNIESYFCLTNKINETIVNIVPSHCWENFKEIGVKHWFINYQEELLPNLKL